MRAPREIAEPFLRTPAASPPNQQCNSVPAASHWSLGSISAVDSSGRTIWISDAQRDDGKRFVARADETLTTFLKPNLLSRSGDLIALHAREFPLTCDPR